MKLLKSNTVQNHYNRATLLSVTSVTVLAVFALLITACDSKDKKATAAPSSSVPVDAVKVRQDNVPLAGDWVGTLDGVVNAQIPPQVSGYLVHLNYREGSSVAKDQVLFEIDRR